MSDIRTLIEGGYASFANHDIPDVLSRFAEDITWTVPEADGWGGTFHGKEGALGFFSQLPGRYGPWDLRPERYIEAGDTLVVLGHHCAGDVEVPFCHVWTVRDGLAQAFQEYVDNGELGRIRQANGMLPVGAA